MANLITLGRLVLFFVTIGMIYSRQAIFIQIATVTMIVVIASDALDGWVARRRGSTSDFGSVVTSRETGLSSNAPGSSSRTST